MYYVLPGCKEFPWVIYSWEGRREGSRAGPQQTIGEHLAPRALSLPVPVSPFPLSPAFDAPHRARESDSSGNLRSDSPLPAT